MSRERGRQAGFTLLEMLVAMALFSLVLSFFGALFYNLGATNTAIGRIERLENVDVVRRYLQQSLEGIRAHSRIDANGVRTLHFIGEQSRVAFVGASVGEREIGGLYETELWLDTAGRLVQQRRPLGRGGEDAPEVLLEGVASLTLSYSPCPHVAPDREVHRWKDVRHLPFLVLIAVTFRAGDSREWREIRAFIPTAACASGV